MERDFTLHYQNACIIIEGVDQNGDTIIFKTLIAFHGDNLA